MAEKCGPESERHEEEEEEEDEDSILAGPSSSGMVDTGSRHSSLLDSSDDLGDENVAVVEDDVDALLDNTINEQRQERILQDHRTPERHTTSHQRRQIIKQNLFSDRTDDDDDVVVHQDTVDDDVIQHDLALWPSDDANFLEEELLCTEDAELEDENWIATLSSAPTGDRVWRKRKLVETQNSFPSKKLFPEKTDASGSGPLPGASTEKKRFSAIPTKDNPPVALSGWLQQFQHWSNAERLLAIDELIERCEPTQVRHMMQMIEPQFQRDFISLLPKELALNVLSFLEPKDLLRAAQTCRSWRFLADDNLLWREKCRQAGINQLPQIDPTIYTGGGHLAHEQEEEDEDGSAPTSPSDEVINPALTRALLMATSPSPSALAAAAANLFTASQNGQGGIDGLTNASKSPWKAAFMRQHSIEMNWRVRPIKPPKVLKGHDDHVITCLQFCGNRIVSGSDDNTLKVWSAITGKCLKTLVGHTGGVWSSQMSGSIIISGSTDRTLKVWNAETGVCIHTLYGHTSTVRCMHLHENRVVSGSRDATLRIWDVVTGECLHVLVGHLAAVRCVQYDGRLVVSGAYDYMVKVWNPEREECLYTLQGHTNRVYSLQFDGVHVVSGSLDTSIRVWEVETGACKHTLMGHQSLTSGMELRNNILVSGNADSTVKVWDIVTGQCLQTLSGANKHQSAVTCLQFNSQFVITSSDDGTVKLWDVRTGAFIRNLIALDSGGSGGVVWRIRANDTKLVCAVGSRNGTEETKLIVLDFDVEPEQNLLLYQSIMAAEAADDCGGATTTTGIGISAINTNGGGCVSTSPPHSLSNSTNNLNNVHECSSSSILPIINVGVDDDR